MRPHSMLLLLCALFAAADALNPCDRSLIRDVLAEEVNYDNATKTLTCNDGSDSLMAIEFNSKLYESLTCDEVMGWNDSTNYRSDSNKMREKGIANASEPISVKCVEYCTVESRTGIVSGLISSNNSKTMRKVTCDEGRKLFVDGVQVVGIQLCDINVWIPSGQSIDTPLQAECRKGCTQGDRTDVIMSLSSDKESKTVFKSSKPEEDGDQHGVSVNGKVYPFLECDSKEGFTDMDGNTIAADPFGPIDLNHDIVPTTTTTTTTVATTTTAKTTPTTPSGGQPPKPQPGPPPAPSVPSKEESSAEQEEPKTSAFAIGVSIVALVLIVVVIVMISIVLKKKPENKSGFSIEEKKKREEFHDEISKGRSSK